MGQPLVCVRCRCALVILATGLFLGWNGLAFAGEHYLAPGHPDGLALLPPPPEAGSAEAAADLATVRAACKARTPDEEVRAKREESLSVNLFAPVIGQAFQFDKLPKTAALLKEVQGEIGGVVDVPKNHWKRLRPFQVDKELLFGRPERGFSYPSGHSTGSTVYALVLADIFPEKREAILAEGREIGWDRVLVGKHFPTDIQAGRVLGQAIFHELEASPAFQHDILA